jgi:hypothetical protein
MEGVRVCWTCHSGGDRRPEYRHSRKIVAVVGVQWQEGAWEEGGGAEMPDGCAGYSHGGVVLVYAYEAEGKEPQALVDLGSNGELDSLGVAFVEQGEEIHSPLAERERHLETH